MAEVGRGRDIRGDVLISRGEPYPLRGERGECIVKSALDGRDDGRSAAGAVVCSK